MTELTGVMPPVVTPFDSNEVIREGALRDEIQYHLDAGVHGISVCGSTGEGNALSVDEHERVYSIAVEEAGDRVPVIGGIIATSAREASEKAAIASDVGVDYVMVTPPHYQTPTDDGLVDYFRAVGRAGGLPILIYDVIEKVDVTADLAARIAAEVPELYGIKQSGGDFHGLANMIATVGDELRIISALDDLLYPAFTIGAVGSIAGTNAICPRLSVELWDAVQAGDEERAERVFWATRPLARRAVWDYDVNFPGGVKAAIRLLGRDVGHARSPIRQPDDETLAGIEDAIGYLRERGVREAPADAERA